MDNRIVEFIRGLRAAGVRVSLAESVDALHAVETLGITDKEVFRSLLRTTLVKESSSFAAFEELFPLYFGSGGPPLQNALEDLSPEDQELMKMALSALSGRMQQLLDWLSSGEGPSKEELEQMARQAGVEWADNQQEARWVTRRMLQQMGFAHLEEQMQQLYERLQEMGMSQEAIEKLMGVVEANRESLAEQVAQQVGKQIAEQRANRPRDLYGSDLMQKSFGSLTDEDMKHLRQEAGRLVTQLRSRAALRRKRGNKGKFDPKGTIRSNLRNGGVPIELKFKKKKLKPSLLLMCDVSGSMRSIAEFMLRLVYEMQDQVSKTRSFAYYWDMVEVGTMLRRDNLSEAIIEILDTILPYRSYATDLGFCLEQFYKNSLDAVNGRTTVVMLGDGRNNFNPARADLIKELQHRAKRLIWFTPEPQSMWREGDCDMWEYYPHCDDVFVVRNLAQLATAVDRLLADA